jgi:hypothetical protein
MIRRFPKKIPKMSKLYWIRRKIVQECQEYLYKVQVLFVSRVKGLQYKYLVPATMYEPGDVLRNRQAKVITNYPHNYRVKVKEKVITFTLYHYQLVRGKALHHQVITFYLKGYPLTRIMLNDLLLVRNRVLYKQSEHQNVIPCACSFMQMQKQPKQYLVLCSFVSNKKEGSERLKMQDAKCGYSVYYLGKR